MSHKSSPFIHLTLPEKAVKEGVLTLTRQDAETIADLFNFYLGKRISPLPDKPKIL